MEYDPCVTHIVLFGDPVHLREAIMYHALTHQVFGAVAGDHLRILGKLLAH